MFRITPIGSCRVAGPLQLAQSKFGYETYKSRSYGYCHSSGEAVQMVRFMRKEFEPPPEIWPLIARSVTYSEIAAQTHDPADLYVIELSSAKRITLAGVFVQLNYLTSAYRDFFSNEVQVRKFWAAAESRDQLKIDKLLAAADVPQNDRKILRQLRLEMTTKDQLEADIQTLKNLLPNIMIVTHVNAVKPDGKPISSRSKFIHDVKDAAAACDVFAFDPTYLMLEMGQQDAIADYSEGLAHYTDDFADLLVDAWAENVIYDAIDKTVLGGDAQTVTNVLAPHIEAVTNSGQLRPLTDRLKRLMNKRSELEELEPIAIALSVAQNDAEAVFNKLSQHVANNPEDAKAHQQCADLALELGRFADLVIILERLLQLGRPTPLRQLLYVARTATRWGYDAEAVCVLCIALAGNPTSATTANLLARTLIKNGKNSVLQLPFDLRAFLLQQIEPINQIRLSDLGGWQHTLDQTAMLPRDVVEIAAYLTQRSEISRAARIIAAWQSTHAGTPLPSDLGSILSRWCDIAQDAKTLREKVDLYAAVRTAAPHHKKARTELQSLRNDVREQMRDAVATNNPTALDNLVTINAVLPTPLKEIHLYRARQRFEAGDYKSAISIGREAARVLPNNISVWMLLMRAAVKEGDLIATDHFAQKVIELADVDTAKLETEATKCRFANATACAQAISQETDPQRAAKLRAIAHASTAVFRHQPADVL